MKKSHYYFSILISSIQGENKCLGIYLDFILFQAQFSNFSQIYPNNLFQGKLDLDKPVQHYVPDFPAKHFMGEEVTITPRQLLNHTSGIRHYRPDKEPFAGVNDVVNTLLSTVGTASAKPFFIAEPLQKAIITLSCDFNKIPN